MNSRSARAGNYFGREFSDEIFPADSSPETENGGGVDVGASVRGRSAGRGRRHAGSNSDRRVQPSQRKPTASRTKKAVSSWCRRLSACRYPSTESVADPPDEACVCLSVRRNNQDAGGLLMVEGRNSQQATTGQACSSSAAAEAAAATAPADRSMRNSPLCPCFSPIVSDDDDDDWPTDERPTDNTNMTADGRMAAVARDMRQRLVVAAAAASQTAGPMHVRRPASQLVGAVRRAHSSVEYTHFLVPDLAAIAAAPYYWGVMDRFEAERLLDSKPEGTFLLRDSVQTDYLFSVSFRRYQRTLHARVEQRDHHFSFDAFDPDVFRSTSVTGLIANYKNPAQCMFFEPQLSAPLPRSFVFPLQHLCRARLASSLADYDAVGSLPLPERFKPFLREYHYRHVVRTTHNEPTASATAAVLPMRTATIVNLNSPP